VPQVRLGMQVSSIDAAHNKEGVTSRLLILVMVYSTAQRIRYGGGEFVHEHG